MICKDQLASDDSDGEDEDVENEHDSYEYKDMTYE